MMTPTRRTVLKSGLALGAALAWSPLALARREESLRVLILGGTGFLGPWLTDAAIGRGHKVTLFNRGRTETRRREIHNPVEIPAGVEVLHGNRDPQKTADDWKPAEQRDPSSPKGLSQLEGRKWDACLDTSGYYPRIVGASADLLAPAVAHYTFISTVSVYKDTGTPNGDESSALGTIADPTVENMGAQFENYGPLKALCEQVVEKTFPGRSALVRPGFIVGPGDGSGRFTYWPVRAAKGGDMVAPGTPDDPLQLIDVRDLAEWCIRLAEGRTSGAFDALGPSKPLRWGDVLAACNQAGGDKAKLVWVPTEFIEKQGLMPGGDFPIWMPAEGEFAGFHRRSCQKAAKAGLVFRPVADTAKATLEWFQSLDERTPFGKPQGITPEKEANLLAEWAKRGK
jgi:2'-hydroxyisoflavone reductase